MPIEEDTDFLRSRPEYAHFRGALGAVDGTLIPACIRRDRQQAFYDRHGQVSQNVLAVVSFNDLFLYVLAGWEGSAHDSTVFQNALHRGLRIPRGKYLLADSGFRNDAHCLSPYRQVLYHLTRWQQAGRSPERKEELFNRTHSCMRSHVECAFGQVKARFPILKLMRPYSFALQCDIVIACFVLHNFIKLRGGSDFVYDTRTEDEHESNAVGDSNTPSRGARQQALIGHQRRDNIATALWESRTIA
ncbi:unnamed protein product [Closterium sp. NIES-53]